MIDIAKLLHRISSSINKDSVVKQRVADTVRLQTHVQLTEGQISIRDGVLEIDASPSARSEISLHQQAILETLKSQQVFVSRILYK